MRVDPDGDHGCSHGFTLIEVVGAVLLFSVALLMVIQLSASVGEQLDRAAISVEIVSLARERMDSLESVAFDSLTVGADSDTMAVRGRSYSRAWSVSLYSPILKELSVSLSPVGGTGPSYSTASYKAGTW